MRVLVGMMVARDSIGTFMMVAVVVHPMDVPSTTLVGTRSVAVQMVVVVRGLIDVVMVVVYTGSLTVARVVVAMRMRRGMSVVLVVVVMVVMRVTFVFMLVVVMGRLMDVLMLVVVAMASSNAARSSVDDQPQRLLLTSSLAPGQHIFDAGILADFGAASLLPLDVRPKLVRQEAMAENVVGDMGQTLMGDGEVSEFEALADGLVFRGAVNVDVREPENGREILDNELDSNLGGKTHSLFDDFLNREAALDTLAILALPPRNRAVLGLDVALAKDIVKHVLQIKQGLLLVFELDELRRRRQIASRREVVCNPQFGTGHCVSYGGSGFVLEKL